MSLKESVLAVVFAALPLSISRAQSGSELEQVTRHMIGSVFAGSSMDTLRELCD